MVQSLRNRWFGAGVLLAYVLVAGFLLPLHALHDAAGADAPKGVAAGTESGTAAAAAPGTHLDPACGSGPCHDPGHRHGPVHDHDPATCASCAARGLLATAPAAVAPVTAAPLETPLPASPAVSAPEVLRSAFLARGPPARV